MRLWKVVPSALLTFGLSACGAQTSPSIDPFLPAAADTAFLQQQRSELAAMRPPSGVDPATWRQLKAALAAQLTAAPRGTSLEPISPGSAPKLSASNGKLHWLYSLQGDYDQNGEVNVADLAPLAKHFKDESGGGPFPYTSVDSVIDGDGNGEINASDLGAIAVNLGRQVQRYTMWRSQHFIDYPQQPDGTNGVTAQSAGFITGQGQGLKEAQRLTYDVGVTAANGWFYWVRPSDGPSDGTPSNVASFGAPANDTLPQVEVDYGDPIGVAPHTVGFGAQNSTDADGTIVNYQWDFDGDGFVDLASTSPIAQYTCVRNGVYHATVLVFDNRAGVGTLPSPMTIQILSAPQ